MSSLSRRANAALDAIREELIGFITNKMLESSEASISFSDEVNLMSADEAMNGLKRDENSVVMITTSCNNSGLPFEYDILDSGVVTTSDLIWVVQQLEPAVEEVANV